MATLWLDFRFALRMLVKSPGFTAIALGALAVGIGANITIFGFVNGLVLRPLDVPQPDRLVRADLGGSGVMRLLYESDYLEYRDRNQTFASLAMFHHGWMSRVRIGDRTQMIAVAPISGNYFETLGVTTTRGRLIGPDDELEDAPPVVVVTHEGIRRFFHTDSSVIGQEILLDSEPHTVVGVVPESFRGTTLPGVPQIYSTFRPTRRRKADPPGYFFGRLRDGVSASEADADLQRIALHLTEERGIKKTIATYPGTAAAPQIARRLGPLVSLIAVVVAAVLWIACSNVAMLLLARAAARRREIGVRIALGASRGSLIRQLLIESLLLSTLAGAGASYFAHVTSQMLTRMYLPVPMPIAVAYELDARVILFAFALSLATTFFFGLGPAREALRTDVVSAVKSGDHASAVGRSRLSFQLVVTQVAASTALLAMTALMVRSVTHPPDVAVEVDGVMTAVARLPQQYGSPAERAALTERLLERLESTPGIASANAVRHIPQTQNQGEHVPVDMFPSELTVTDTDGVRPLVYDNRVSRGHFGTLGIPLLAGRDFESQDAPGAPAVAIVNETYAQRFWPGESPIGKTLRDGSGASVRIIGLAADSKYRARDEEATAFVYRPFAQAPIDSPTFFVKSTLAPAETAELMREQIDRVDPDIAVYNMRTLDERLTPGVHVALAWITGVLGLFGALLGAIGTYGLVSWSVHERRREFGIRTALGASRSRIVHLTTGEGVRWAAVGVALGLVVFLGGTQLIKSFLGGVSPYDPVGITAVASILLATAYLACWLPAVRQTRSSPTNALRE